MNTYEMRRKLKTRREAHELRRDSILDLLGVYAPMLAPLVPAGLMAASIYGIFPDLLHITSLAAAGIAAVVVIVTEVLALISTETYLEMRSHNQTYAETEHQAPEGYAGFIVGLYVVLVLTLVVFLKMFASLAIWSLIPLSLMGVLTSWIVMLRKGFEDTKLTLAELAEQDNRERSLHDKLDSLAAENDRLLSEIGRLNGQIERLEWQASRTESAEDSGMSTVSGLDPAVGNQANQDKKQANLDMLFTWLAINPDRKKTDMVDMFAANGIELSDKTVGRYLAELGAIRDGHTYRLPENEPEMVYTNGVSG